MSGKPEQESHPPWRLRQSAWIWPSAFSKFTLLTPRARSSFPGQFRSGRQFAAWLGLTPQQNSSGGKERLGRITKMGDKYLRNLLVVGATSLVLRARHKPETADQRLVALLARKSVRVATVAMANKIARIVRAVMTRGEVYQAVHAPMLAG